MSNRAIQNVHTANAQDDIPAIAAKHGLFWQTIWDHPDNRGLRDAGRTPNQLLKGDAVSVPEMLEKGVDAAAETRHRFIRKGVPSKLRVQLALAGEPRANEPYTVAFGNTVVEGMTDADGFVEECVTFPPELDPG